MNQDSRAQRQSIHSLYSLVCVLTLFFVAIFNVSAATTESHFSKLSGEPKLRSASALITDSSGEIIYSKDVDTVRPIASLTKLMTAMVILDSGLSLDEKITITKEDRDLVRLTGSRLEYGATLSRREMLQLALMSSENRAATALGRTYPGGMNKFVAAMNIKAGSLGMSDSQFSDPAGLHTNNQATASDVSKMVAAARSYSLITQATTTTRKEVHPYSKRGPLRYGNTNRLLKNKSWDIALSKTGYINEAGRCLVMSASIDGEEVSIILLNSFGKLTPFGDSNRLRKWMLANS
ncbi:MAG: D-alanyl-D-alanine endopeptidase (penicillin-binding protein 7) [Halioglobus sp.]|jgi:D-alanyl-D-alanine endopeptidase (penicillin-binding protein 7)